MGGGGGGESERGQGVGPRERTPGGADPASPASPTKPSKKKRLRGRERVKAMLKDSQWSWKNSALDPRFKRPKIRFEEEKRQIQLIEHNRDREEQRFRRGRSVPRGGSDQIHTQEMPGVADTSWNQAGKMQGSSSSGGEGELGRQESRASICSISSSDILPRRSNPSAPLKREHLTLSTVLDCILRGEILKGSDILTQRLKSLEQIAHGAPAHLALKLEILPPESTTLASIEESRTAATQHHRELKVAEVWKGKGKQGSWGPSPPLTPGNHQRAEREQRFRRKGNSRERRQGRQGEQGRAIWENSYSGPDIIVDDVSRSPELTGGFSLGRTPEDAGADAVGCSFNSERHPARELKGAPETAELAQSCF